MEVRMTVPQSEELLEELYKIQRRLDSILSTVKNLATEFSRHQLSPKEEIYFRKVFTDTYLLLRLIDEEILGAF
jgi:hypothetical protein